MVDSSNFERLATESGPSRETSGRRKTAGMWIKRREERQEAGSTPCLKDDDRNITVRWRNENATPRHQFPPTTEDSGEDRR